MTRRTSSPIGKTNIGKAFEMGFFLAFSPLGFLGSFVIADIFQIGFIETILIVLGCLIAAPALTDTLESPDATLFHNAIMSTNQWAYWCLVFVTPAIICVFIQDDLPIHDFRYNNPVLIYGAVFTLTVPAISFLDIILDKLGVYGPFAARLRDNLNSYADQERRKVENWTVPIGMSEPESTGTAFDPARFKR